MQLVRFLFLLSALCFLISKEGAESESRPLPFSGFWFLVSGFWFAPYFCFLLSAFCLQRKRAESESALCPFLVSGFWFLVSGLLLISAFCSLLYFGGGGGGGAVAPTLENSEKLCSGAQAAAPGRQAMVLASTCPDSIIVLSASSV
jgi:hypothetical protein